MSVTKARQVIFLNIKQHTTMIEKGTDDQVRSLNQSYSVDFSQSRIGVKNCIFKKEVKMKR